MIFVPFIPIFLFLILCACIGVDSSSSKSRSRHNNNHNHNNRSNYTSYGRANNDYINGYGNSFSSYGREENFSRVNQRQNPVSISSVSNPVSIKTSNNANKRLNPQLHEREKSGINRDRVPLQSTISEREYIQSQQQEQYMNEPPQVQTNYEKRLAQERQAKQQNRNIPSIYQQNRSDNNRQTGYQPGPSGQASTISSRYSQQNNNNNSGPGVNISDLKGKPGLMEILNQNRKNR